MKAVSIIRQRGQLTLPNSLRKKLKWLQSESPVLISVNDNEELIIQPATKPVGNVPENRKPEEPKRIKLFQAR